MIGDCGQVHFDIGDGTVKINISKNSKVIDNRDKKSYDVIEH